MSTSTHIYVQVSTKKYTIIIINLKIKKYLHIFLKKKYVGTSIFKERNV